MNWPCDDIEPAPKDKRWCIGAKVKKDYPKWTFFLAWGLVALALFLCWAAFDARAEEPFRRAQQNGQGEPLGTHKAWGLHPSLGVVFRYEIEGKDVFYAHPIMAHGPVGECDGLMGKHENCKAFAMRMGSIVLMTIENETPYLYMAQILPSHKRVNGGEYVSLVGVTFQRECE